MKKILLVDDEPDILEFVSYNLRKAGFDIYTASNGQDAIDLALRVLPHLIILDMMMPGMNGLEACKKIRLNPRLSHTLIAFLTACSEDYSQLAGFEAGADDYISKPVSPKVLTSRVKALLKRVDNLHPAAQFLDVTPSIKIDEERHVVTLRNNTELSLPRKEFELLCLLSSKPDKLFSREEIFVSIWGRNVVVGDRTIDVHIRKLREKIGDHYIETVKGLGYKFKEP